MSASALEGGKYAPSDEDSAEAEEDSEDSEDSSASRRGAPVARTTGRVAAPDDASAAPRPADDASLSVRTSASAAGPAAELACAKSRGGSGGGSEAAEESVAEEAPDPSSESLGLDLSPNVFAEKPTGPSSTCAFSALPRSQSGRSDGSDPVACGFSRRSRSRANRREPANPNASPPNAAKSAGVASTGASPASTRDASKRRVAAANASAAASTATRPLIAAFAPKAASWKRDEASMRAETRTKDAAEESRPEESADDSSPTTSGRGGTDANAEWPPRGAHVRRARHVSDVSAEESSRSLAAAFMVRSNATPRTEVRIFEA